MNQKKLIPLLIIAAITLTIATPVAYAPGKRNDPFGDHVGNLIDERNDPKLINLANKEA